jgi:hypothetical protein
MGRDQLQTWGIPVETGVDSFVFEQFLKEITDLKIVGMRRMDE